jgi:hypothetical protein
MSFFFFWSRVSDLMRLRDESAIRTESNIVQISEKVRRRHSQLIGKLSGKKEWAEHGNSKLTETGEKRDSWRAKSRACSFSLTLRGLFTRNSSLQAKQSIPHSLVTFYNNRMKMFEDFAPNFDNKITISLQRSVLHFPFQQDFFLPKTMTLVPIPTFFFPRVKIKLKGHHFDTTEAIEAE